jgi:hypothetical protein
MKLRDGLIEPVLLISGASGAGKSYVIKLLNQLGVESAPRLITRPGRVSDAESDLQWDPSESASGSSRIHFAYKKYDNFYGFRLKDFICSVKAGTRSAYIAGDLGKIAPMVEAMNSVMPLVPIISLRLEVPLQLVKERLATLRQEAFAGEAAQRTNSNSALESWEASQIQALKNFYDLHTLLNITVNEHARLNVPGLEPMGSELINKLVAQFIVEAKKRSALMAREILKEIPLNSVAGAAPPELIEVLRDRLVPIARAKHAIPVLKGGLAVALYLANADHTTPESEKLLPLHKQHGAPSDILRKVSNDVDWTLVDSIHNRASHLEMIEMLSGQPVEMRDYLEKPIFNSLKASSVCSAPSGGAPVELDLIARSRVRPPGSDFCFEFVHDSVLGHYRRDIHVDGQPVLQMVPPEMLVLEKLVAARGSELNKFDLFDAVSLIMVQPLCATVFKRMLESQRYNQELDRPALQDGEVVYNPDLIKDDALRAILNVRRNSPSSAPNEGTDVEHAMPGFELSLAENGHTLKQFALLDAALAGISKARSQVDSSVETVSGQKSLSEIFGREKVLESLAQFEKLLYYLARFQIGREDIFVKRDIQSVAANEAFFAEVASLRDRINETPSEN